MATVCHAILIEGGSPETRMAKAMELLKHHFEGDPMAAGKLDAGTFEDLVFVEHEDGSDIKVKDIEDLIGLFNQKPFASTGKACIITRGESMNEHAQNKFLKLLEEPAGRDVLIVLAENAGRLLPTVRSRLIRVWLGYAEPERAEVTEDLKNLTAALVYGKGTLAGANRILSGYDGSREEAAAFVSSFQIFLRSIAIGEIPAAQISGIHAEKIREGVLYCEKALDGLERGERVRYVLRRMALKMRA